MGYWFVVWIWAMWDRRPWTGQRDDFRFLWWMSMPTFLFFMAFGLKNGGGEPNWPVTAYLSGMVLAVGWLVEQLNDAAPLVSADRVRILLVVFVCLGLGMTVLIHYTGWPIRCCRGWPARRRPTRPDAAPARSTRPAGCKAGGRWPRRWIEFARRYASAAKKTRSWPAITGRCRA